MAEHTIPSRDASTASPAAANTGTNPPSPAASTTFPPAANTGTRPPSPAASATSPPAANTALFENRAQLENEKKRKPTKNSEFQVLQLLENPKKGKYSLKLIKPFSSKIDVNACPTVHLKEERASDERAFHIMHGFHHKNILRMKSLTENKMQTDGPLAVAAFVEPYEGTLWSICKVDVWADTIKHIPSPRFQGYVREIVNGIDFLIKNNLYHGNLNWETTLRSGDTVKLAGFKLKELMNDEEAKWDDWLCFIKMLERVSERAHEINSHSSQSEKFFCGNLDSLIGMMKSLDCTSLLLMKDIILEDPFFWKFATREKFFANTISLKLSDDDFMNRVSNSTICEKSWDKNCTDGFKLLVKQMNDHREAEREKSEKNRNRGDRRGGHGGGRRGRRDNKSDNKSEKYDGDSKEHYIKCICGAYSHHRQMKLKVDQIVRENHPTIFRDMKVLMT